MQTSTRKTILMIAHCFPPMISAGTTRTYNWAVHLSRNGFKPIVFTSPVPANAIVDSDIDTNGLLIVPKYCPRWWPQDHLFSKGNKIIRERSSVLRRLFSMPFGKNVLLLPYAVLNILKVARQQQVDLIYARSGPYVSLLFAWVVSRFRKVPLILDLHDPWTTNFLQCEKSAPTRWIEKQMERIFFKRAALVIFNTETIANQYRALYPSYSEKIHFVYTGFDSTPLKERSNQPTDQKYFQIIHYGNCFANRTLKPVADALNNLRQKNKWPAGGVRLTNFGRIKNSDVAYFESIGLKDTLEAKPPTRSSEGLRHLSLADLLLLLSYGDSTGFVPIKTYDYFRVRKRILCLSSCPELQGMIRSTNLGETVEASNVSAIERFIEEAFGKASEPITLTTDQEAAWNSYSSGRCAERLVSLITQHAAC